MDMDTEQRFVSLVSQLISPNTTYSEEEEIVLQIISMVISMDLESQPKPESKFMSLIAQAVFVFNSMDLDSQPEPLSKLIQLVTQKLSLSHSIDSDSEPKENSEFTSLVYETRTLQPEPELMSIIQQIVSLVISMDPELKLMLLISRLASLKDIMESDPDSDWDSKFISVMTRMISLVISMDLESQPKPKSELMSLITETIYVFNSMDLDSQPKPLSELISLITQKVSLVDSSDSELMSLIVETWSVAPKPELISLIDQILYLSMSMDSEPEMEFMSVVAKAWRLKLDNLEPGSKLTSLLLQLHSLSILVGETAQSLEVMANLISLVSVISKIISLVTSLDFDLLPKPHTNVISLFSQIITVANSISDSETEWEFISLMNQFILLIRSIDLEQESPPQLFLLLNELASHLHYMDSKSELGSLINQLGYSLQSMGLESEPEAEWELDQLISLSPQLNVELVQGKFHVKGKVERKSKENGNCQPENRHRFYLARGEDTTHFHCQDCNGEDHEECEKTPVEVRHPLHPKHPLLLVSQKSSRIQTRKCFCCDEDLQEFFYYCSVCDYAMNIACVEKPPVLSIHHPKWHEHTLYWFPRRVLLTCNVCALDDASSPIYMCPNCDFVVHLRCVSLPKVIRISRHPHRIAFTFSFDQGDWSCGVCRRKIDNDYGGYSCIKEGCLYAAHSRCATQTNVWDGTELEGVQEDIEEEEEVEPFVRIRDGIICHFSHQQHHLQLDVKADREYDENKLCHACFMPVYFGNVYSCMEECEFIIHEECANLPRKIHHPIHAHLLTLMGGYNGVIKYGEACSACPWSLTGSFVYGCGKEGCSFKLHVQCATISEPLVHGSHIHPLFLTSKPGEQRVCSVCKDSKFTNETFNCIEECDFALCFACATLPQKVRYKHDKHILTLSYGKETSTIAYWCEICEGEVNPKERFYACDEYCCVTLHTDCLIVKDLYMMPGSSCIWKFGNTISVLPNNHMSRPFCFYCKKRCLYTTFLQDSSLAFCSTDCLMDIHYL